MNKQDNLIQKKMRIIICYFVRLLFYSILEEWIILKEITSKSTLTICGFPSCELGKGFLSKNVLVKFPSYVLWKAINQKYHFMTTY